MTSGGFQKTIDTLGGDDMPRVWSLIVTVFGDLAQRSGDEIAGPVLGEILAPVGVRPEAMRVALHRLRNEGWIETRKQGRTALHGLSTFGLAQSAAASKQIYGTTQQADLDWHILCFAPSTSTQEQTRSKTLALRGYVNATSGIYIKSGAANHIADDAIILQGEMKNVPSWLSDVLAPMPLRAGFQKLAQALETINIDESFARALTPLQTATLRTLIVHHWRKLVLKLPLAPDVLFGNDFEGTQCRDQVLRALKLLERPKRFQTSPERRSSSSKDASPAR